MPEVKRPVVAGVDLSKPETFRHWTLVTLRFSDQDPYGHVNNVAYAAYAEQGRVAYFTELLARAGRADIDFVLASVKIDYLREMRFPGTVEVGTRLLAIGNKSVTSGVGMFKDGAGVATAESVNVFFDTGSGETIAIPDDVRSLLQKELP